MTHTEYLNRNMTAYQELKLYNSISNLIYTNIYDRTLNTNKIINAIKLLIKVNADFIETNNIQYSKDITPSESYKHLKETFNGVMAYDNRYSDNSIYGNKHLNALFRVVHDYLHLTYNLDFSLQQETTVAYIHNTLITDYGLKHNYDLEIITTATRLMYIDIVEQGKYYWDNKEFVTNQLKFDINLLCKSLG